MTASVGDDLAQALFHQSGDALFLFDPATEQVLDVNVVAQKLTGIPRAELLQMKAHQLFHFVGKEGKSQGHASTAAGAQQAQEGYYLHTRQHGTWIPVLLTIAQLNVVPQPLGLITARDIRMRRAAHAQLVQKEGELRRVLAAVSDCFWQAVIGANGQWTYRWFSPLVERVTGYPAMHFMPGLHRWWHIVHPDDRPRCEQVVRRLRGGLPSHAVYRVVWPDGSIHWLRDQVQVSQAPDGRALWLEGRMTDITERKRAEEELHLRNAALEALAEGVFIFDAARPEQPIVHVNAAVGRLTGEPAGDLLGRGWRTLLGPDCGSVPRAELDRAVEGRRGCCVELFPRRLLSLTPIRDRKDHVTHFVGVLAPVGGPDQQEQKQGTDSRCPSVVRAAHVPLPR
jgi:PAS domain S-box-containing protein